MDRSNSEIEERVSEELGYQAPKIFHSTKEIERPSDMWHRLEPLILGQRDLESHRIISQPKPDQAQRALDMMRTKVGMALSKNGWKSIIVTSPTAGCGKTTLSVNLAFGLARQTNYKVVLIDLDLRKPKIGKMLNVPGTHSMEKYLRGHAALQDSFLRFGENLAVGFNSLPVTGPAELLQSPTTVAIFQSLMRQLNPDVVIYDMPPMLANDDVLAFLPMADSALLVAEAGGSSIAEIDICESELSKQTNFVGVVLNKCKHTPDKYGY